MNPYDFVHLVLHAMGDEIQGKTKLQKTVYFVSVALGKAQEMGFRAHYYGPYSDSVAASVSRLVALGFATQNSISYGAVNPDGFEIARHDFTLTPEGKAIANAKANKSPEEFERISKAVKVLKSAGNIDYMKMSVAAKTYYILDKAGKPASPAQLSEAAKKLGWTPSPEEILESMKFLEKLSLVK